MLLSMSSGASNAGASPSTRVQTVSQLARDVFGQEPSHDRSASYQISSIISGTPSNAIDPCSYGIRHEPQPQHQGRPLTAQTLSTD